MKVPMLTFEEYLKTICKSSKYCRCGIFTDNHHFFIIDSSLNVLVDVNLFDKNENFSKEMLKALKEYDIKQNDVLDLYVENSNKIEERLRMDYNLYHVFRDFKLPDFIKNISTE